MFTRRWRLGSVLVLLAANVCAGQDQPQPDGDPGVRRRPRARPEKVGRHSPGRQLNRMAETLNLDEKQVEAARALFEENRTKTRELREAYRPSPEMRERLKAVRTEIKAAREAGDDDRMQEVLAEMRALRTEQQESAAPMRAEMEEAQQVLHDGLLAILRDDQKAAFEELWEKRLAGRFEHHVPQRSPRALKSIVDKLQDLTTEQEQQIDALFKAHAESARGVKSDPKGTRKATKKLYDDVLLVLTDEQRSQVQKRLKGRGPQRRGHNRPGRPERPFRPDQSKEPDQPKEAEEAAQGA